MNRTLTMQPSIRLAGGAETPDERAQFERDVAVANREAASLGRADAREIFAVRVSDALDGGRAAVLTPENRRRLVDLGERMGLRAFDANLVIAIVQDGARRGERVTDESLGGRLRLVHLPARRTLVELAGPLLAAAAIALGVILALIAWITSG